MNRSRTLLVLLLALCSAPLLAAPSQDSTNHAEHAKSSAQKSAPPKERVVRTQHSVVIDGTTIKYTATAGTIILRNRKNQPTASVFYIAYTKDGANPDRRPVTFAYNGGPGSASALVNIGGFGPMHVVWPVPGGDAKVAQPPYTLEPNPYSILKSTDLVFIDAVGTGYSRILPRGDAKDSTASAKTRAHFRSSSSATSARPSAGIRPSSCSARVTAPRATRCSRMTLSTPA